MSPVPFFPSDQIIACAESYLGLNLKPEHIGDEKRGYLLYFRRKESARRVTHAGILYSESRCIHCSYYFGRKVVITDLSEIFNSYDLSV